MIAFVAAHGLAGDAVDAETPVDPAPGQDRVDGRGGHAQQADDPNPAQTLSEHGLDRPARQ